MSRIGGDCVPNWANWCCASRQLIGITDGYLSLLQDSGEVREDLKVPEGDLGKEITFKSEAGEEILVSAAA